MKFALLQCNVMPGKITENADKLIAFCKQGREADLCIAPGCALTGPNTDCQSSYADIELEDAFARLAGELADFPALLCYEPQIGYALAHKGQWQKMDNVFTFGGERMGVDLTAEEGREIDVGIAMKPRPFTPVAHDEWELIFSGFCRQFSIAGLSANLCGGYGGWVYAGQSVAMRRDGTLAARARSFAEDCLMVTLGGCEQDNRIESLPPGREAALWEALVLGVRDFARKNDASRVVLGLSGGMDSALVACVAAAALGAQNVDAIFMPSPYTSQESYRDARELAKNLGIGMKEVPITPMLKTFNDNLGPVLQDIPAVAGAVTEENLQARLRGVILMAITNQSGALVLNTGNKSELAMGYCTLYGDMVGALAVIGDLFKTEVYALAEWYRKKNGIIPDNIFTKAPSAELRPNQKDTDSLPPYAQLDADLLAMLQGNSRDREYLRKLSEKVGASAFKRRQGPPALQISGLPLACPHN